jgi:hypothetical protein
VPPSNLAALLLQSRYPGLLPVENAVARAWLDEHGAEYDRLDFNVRLGQGVKPGQGATSLEHSIAFALTTKRADLIASTANAVTIIEIKERIGPGAIGQLLMYEHLWEQQDGSGRPVHLLAIGRNIVPELAGAFQRHDIAYELFPDVPPSGCLIG